MLVPSRVSVYVEISFLGRDSSHGAVAVRWVKNMNESRSMVSMWCGR